MEGFDGVGGGGWGGEDELLFDDKVATQGDGCGIAIMR